MTRPQRLQRVATLCLYCVKNIAFKRARRAELLNGPENEVWRAVDGHFLDICVLDWCKLFAERNGQHYWKKVVTDHRKFFSGLLKELDCSEADFERHIAEMKVYRDKFVAHLGHESTGYYPLLKLTKTSSIYLYEYLLTNEAEDHYFHGAPNIRKCYSQSSAEANRIYNSILSVGRP